jgi:hypothetical protein
MRSKRIVARAAVAVFGLTLAAALLEGLVRVADVAPALPAQYGDNVRDEAIAFKRRPGSIIRGTSESGEYTFEYAHNSLGFRDTEHSLAKPAHTARVVALGNSFTYGIGADFADTFLSQVEGRLNERAGQHARVEIIKLGLPRHFPLLERLTLERYGLSFAPDVVLVAVTPSDVINTQRGLDTVCVAESGYFVPCAALGWGEAAVWLYLHSAASRMVLQAWSRHADGDQQAASWKSLFADGGPYEPAWRSVERELERMQDDARTHGAAFVVVALQQRPPWREFTPYHEARLRRWSAAHGAVFVPTLAALQAADPSRPIYWPGDGHCTPAGYAIIADGIASAMIANGLTP